MIDRRLLDSFDWSILLVALFLSLVGVLTIYSATRPVFHLAQKSYYIRQLSWLALSLVAFIVFISLDYRWYIKVAPLIFLAGLAFLVIALIAGKKGMGAQRWIDLGVLSFQPSEFFKLCFIISLSRALSAVKEGASLNVLNILKLFTVYFVLPAVLILRQPDLGTAVILFLIFIAMILTAGIRRRIILITLIVLIVSLPFGGKVLWSGLKEYQKQRIVAFIDPQADPQGVGYHITQSKVSIGSGGLLGKGYMKGTQGPYRFLPENHTDFIFSIFAEEWGFLGSLALFVFYLFIIWRGFDTAAKAGDRKGAFLALGVTYMLCFYFLINVGMTLGIVPVVGVPLPLMSYGGTALLSNFLALSMIENVRMRRFALYY